MKKIALTLAIACSLFAIEKKNIVSLMKLKTDKISSIMVLKELTPKEKATQIFPLLEEIFDYELMAKLSLGKTNWTKMSKMQRTEFIQAFISHLKNEYISKISYYTDEKLKILGLKEVNEKRVSLLTKLVGDKDTYDITYKFYKKRGDNWLIYDIDIIGISLIQSYKAQFSTILQAKSFKSLIEKIRAK